MGRNPAPPPRWMRPPPPPPPQWHEYCEYCGREVEDDICKGCGHE